MATKKLSALTAATTLVGADLFLVNDGGGITSKKLSYTSLLLNFANSFQAKDSDLTAISSNGTSTAGLQILKLGNPTEISIMLVADDGTVTTQTLAQLFAALDPQPHATQLDLWASLTPTAFGGTIATSAGASGASYIRANGDVDQSITFQTASQVADALRGSLAGPRYTTITTSTSITIDASTVDIYVINALAANTTFNAPTNPTKGQRLTIMIKDNAGGAWTLTFNAAFVASGIALPTVSPNSLTKTRIIEFMYNTTSSKWDLILSVEALS